MMSNDIITRWETRRTEMSRLRSTVDAASLIEEFLTDLESLAGLESPVTLSEASRQTGYSADHLARLIKNKKLTDHGRKHAPRVKVSECPRKTTLAKVNGIAYNADTDARSLVGSRR